MAEESIFGNSIDYLKKSLGGTAKTAIGLGGALLTGQQQLSAYSGALAKNSDALGKMGGAVGKVIDGLTKFAEEGLQEYQALTTIGATFNKEISDIKVTAAELGMTVEEMTSFLQNNATSLRAFGGTTNTAIARFKALNATILDSKELGIELRRLGFTTKDISEGLSLFGEIVESNSRNEKMTLQQQAEAAKGLMVELDGLAKLTGKNRKELADEMRARRRQGDVNAFLMGKSAEEQEAFMNQLNTMQATLGQDAADAFVDIALRGAPTTDATRNAMLAMGDGADILYDAAAQFNSGAIDQFTQTMIDARGAALDYQDTEEFRNTAILGGVTSVSNGFAEASKAAFDFKKGIDASKEGVGGAADAEREIRNSIAQEQLRQMEQTTGIFDKTIEIQDNLRKLTSATMGEAIKSIEGVAIAGLEKMQAAMPTTQEIISGINKGVNSLFDIAAITDAKNDNDGFMTTQNSLLDEQLKAIEQTGVNIVNSNVEGAEVVNQQIKVTQDQLDSAREYLDKQTAEVDKTTKRVEDMVAAGFTDQDPMLRAAKEAAEIAAARAEATQRAVSSLDHMNRTGSLRGFADGGEIGYNEIGLVGEAGPEFVSGPANVMSAKTSMGVMQTLMKSIRALDNNVQDVQSTMQNNISTNEAPRMFNMESNKKLDTMIGLLGQLIQVENMAVGTQNRQLKVTRGLTGNMLRGV